MTAMLLALLLAQAEVQVPVAPKPAVDGKLEDGCWKDGSLHRQTLSK